MQVDVNTGEIVMAFLRSSYNYSMDDVSRETALVCEDETKTQQQFAEECDINTIVRQFGITGEMPQNVRVPLTDEFVETMDYRSSLDKLMEADRAFMQFPAELRARFGNDPAKFVDFVSDPANIEETRKWNLAKPVVAEAPPMRVEVVGSPTAQVPS